ncbi:MAG TPA: hydroxyethylthiazole kinase [Negativicutes bacterium]|nr:hydroxyethylthiazole kinase [Negativicutes bacterium]
MELIRKASELIPEIKRTKPVVHHITNYVTMNDCANAVLAIGGSPVMANAPEEAAEIAAMSKALVLNLGTPNRNNFQAMLLAGKSAKKTGIPVIFDPVGAGLTPFRRELCQRLMYEIRPEVVKGNLSEIMYLAGMEVCSKGVDSAAAGCNAPEIVGRLAGKLTCIVAATGERDIISDGDKTYLINNGHEMLSKVTGTGCMTSSLIGAFCAAAEDCLTGAFGGVMTMGVAGQHAFSGLKPGEGAGMYKVRLFDSIYCLSSDIFESEGNAYEY